MRCQLIQTTKIADHNLAEREMLDFLKNLPDSSFLYRELKLTPAFLEQTKGLKEQRPDFVVVSPVLGLVSIEVKDWNIASNQYEWIDQYTVRKTDKNGLDEFLDNPVEQTSRYLHAFMDLLKHQGSVVFVTSLLAFPRLSRAEFVNRMSNVELWKNPQSKFYLNLDQTIFKEDLDRHVLNPERLLIELVKKSSRTLNYSPKEIERVNRVLLPPSFIVGDYSKRQANQQQLRIISEKQREWIFGVDRRMNYLLDVPGSGKTNTLVSKAIYFVDTCLHANPRILITTYSNHLATNIHRIFERKILEENSREKYTRAIVIQSVPQLLELILRELYSEEEIEERKKSRSTYDQWASDNVTYILQSEPEKFKVFDGVFIDEIQDFDNFYLLVVDHFLKEKNYFLVGDIGQKIYERQFDLQRLGIVPHQIELPKSYQMYRTPKHIAKLAVDFIWQDAHCRQDFEERGYKGNFNFPNQADYVAEMLMTANPTEEIVRRIKSLLDIHYIADDILVIVSAHLLESLRASLDREQIACTIGEPKNEGFVALVGFEDAKGLEREVVIVAGIEDLYEKTKPEGLFWEESQKIRREGLSRRMIYVAITRTIEQLLIFYEQSTNRFVADLLKINQSILAKRG